MTARPPKSTDLPRNDPVEHPAASPNAIAVVLESSVDDLARVRRWAQHSQDKSIQVEVKDGKLHLQGIDPEMLWYRIEMFEMFGVAELCIQQYLTVQIMGNFRTAAGQEATPDQQQTARRTAWAMLREIRPRDQIEVMLALQMIAVHNVAMEATAGALLEKSPEARQECANRAARMLRIFPAQMEALKKHRGSGQQQITIKHVNVNEGGQAIVGHIETGRRDDREGRV
jgi:hypothetical protein